MADEKKEQIATAPKKPEKFDPTGLKPLLEWESDDHIMKERTAGWYVLVVFVGIVLGGILYWQQLWSGLALIVAAEFVFLVFSNAHPRKVKCAVYDQGVVIDSKVYQYSEFKSFWMTYIDVPKIRLQLVGTIAGQVVMPLLNVNGDQVREILLKYLPEDDNNGEDLIDMINHYMKF